MRPDLRTYRDEAGRELLDVADGVIADPGLPAPIRFLPQYDNVFLSHADRSRLNGGMSWGVDFAWKGVVLVDGFISAAWRVRRERRRRDDDGRARDCRSMRPTRVAARGGGGAALRVRGRRRRGARVRFVVVE